MPCERSKRGLHQVSFRDAVLSAYRGRCAICHLPEPRLLDAAHIIMDADEHVGQPIVWNGLPLTKLHHAAFDAHLIDVDPEIRRDRVEMRKRPGIVLVPAAHIRAVGPECEISPDLDPTHAEPDQ
jgi:hypothetical protein